MGGIARPLAKVGILLTSVLDFRIKLTLIEADALL